MRTHSPAPSSAPSSADQVAQSARALSLQASPQERARWLQRSAGNRATAALLQRSCGCGGTHGDCECEEESLGSRPAIQRAPARPDGLDSRAGALRSAVVARKTAAARDAVHSRNPDPVALRPDEEEEFVTRNCSVTSGPTYTPNGVIPVTTTGGRKRATFNFAATFGTASWWQFWSSADPACCEVRQYIKWDEAFHNYRGGPPHSGFPSTATHGTWYEDRDTADKRYGHRSGTHSDPIAGGGDEYTKGGVRDQANGDQYNGRDSPGGPSSITGQYQFKLAVIDTCDGNREKATSPVITINW
jgi:hypothetical protein